MIKDWPTISDDFAGAPDEHDIIVIGTGYGGGVAAARLSLTDRKVTVLERGQEVTPGNYPNTMTDGLAQFSYTLSHNGDVLGNKDGLFDLRIGNDVNVLVGRGLGGTSLINANVAVEPDDAVFEQWPGPFCNDPTFRKTYFDKARQMLGSAPLPNDFDPPKLRALAKVAEGLQSRKLDATFDRPPINVTFQEGPNSGGVWQYPCNHCGDCVSGCNVGAKNTTLMNYLPDAKRNGAQIYTGAEVTHLTRDADDKYWYVHTSQRLSPLRANFVILAAGTLGSTEILLRSKTLDLSDKLGKQFSGNGDIWAFGYNAQMKTDDGDRAPVYGVGAGMHDPTENPAYAPGPCITGMIKVKGETFREDLLIEEGVMPGALAAAYAGAFPAMDALMGDPFRFGDVFTRLKDAASIRTDLKDLAESAYTGPVSRTMPFLVMSHDQSAGELVLKADRVVVKWPNAGLDPAIVNDAHIIQMASDGINAEYLPTPFWQDAFNNRLVTVHPIGGCAMGKSKLTGVVNYKCQVFGAGKTYFDGLYVCDGSVIPGGVGVNPHLTIAAVAEYAVETLIADQNWKVRSAISFPDPAPLPIAAGTDWGKMLSTLVGKVHAIETAFLKGEPDHIREAIDALWRDIRNAYLLGIARDLQKEFPIAKSETIQDLLKSDRSLITVARPLVSQLRVLLDAVVPKIRDKDATGAITVLETHMGEFSPPFAFDEIMRGTLSNVGLIDKPQPHNPYAVAAHGGAPVIFTAAIETGSIKSATTPPDGVLNISSGVLESAAIGGKYTITSGEFAYVMPVPDQLDHWEMRYSGTAVRDDDKLTFFAFKTLQKRPDSHWWRDLTELRMDVFRNGEPIARGMLTLDLEDLMKQAAEATFSYESDAQRECFAQFYKALASAKSDQLVATLADPETRANAVKGFAFALDNGLAMTQLQKILQRHYTMQTIGKMGLTTLRNYGGVFAYMANFAHQENTAQLRLLRPASPQIYHPITKDGAKLQLTRFNGGSKGPVLLAGGFGTKATSYAISTVKTNMTEMLVESGFDVWLFDYRGSGAIEASKHPFTLDDVAEHDWPTAIDTVLAETGAESVQAIAHCIGCMSLFMAMLAGEKRVSRLIASATGPHAISNWYNFAKSDARLAKYIGEGLPETMWGLIDLFDLPAEVEDAAKHGLPYFDPRSPSPSYSKELNVAIDGLVWDVPSFAPLPCKSPTCHRINFSFGPSYRHAQLNHATHNAIEDVYGPVHASGFQHVAKIFRHGHAISMDGTRDYLDGIDNLSDVRIHFIVGDRNQQMLPESTLRTLDWLTHHFKDHPEGQFTRKVYTDYGHMDVFIGKNAADEIFGELLAILEAPA